MEVITEAKRRKEVKVKEVKMKSEQAKSKTKSNTYYY